MPTRDGCQGKFSTAGDRADRQMRVEGKMRLVSSWSDLGNPTITQLTPPNRVINRRPSPPQIIFYATSCPQVNVITPQWMGECVLMVACDP
ncbi:MAG UNVERIFIED_CONTAM: hypothetical protein LVT10_02690 [Anaerolineae bacterium]